MPPIILKGKPDGERPEPFVTPDIDRIEALLGWLQLHVQYAGNRDQMLTLSGRASGLLEIFGALREHVGDVKWFPVERLVTTPPASKFVFSVRAGDILDMIGTLQGTLDAMRRKKP